MPVEIVSPYFVDTHRTDLQIIFTKTPLLQGQFAEPGTARAIVVQGKYIYGFYFACPGCGKVAYMRAGIPKPKTFPSWLYTGGSPQYPHAISLEPGLKFTGCCGWQGKLKDGIFISV